MTKSSSLIPVKIFNFLICGYHHIFLSKNVIYLQDCKRKSNLEPILDPWVVWPTALIILKFQIFQILVTFFILAENKNVVYLEKH